LLEDDKIQFVCQIHSQNEGSVIFSVFEVASRTCDTNEPIEVEDYLEAMVKFDGCTHVWFGTNEINDAGHKVRDSYLHLCGAYCIKRHMEVMRLVLKTGMELLGKNFEKE
jgi:hypothetical protein